MKNMRISAIVPGYHPLLLALEPRAARKTISEMLSLLLEHDLQLAEIAIGKLIERQNVVLLDLVEGQDAGSVVEKLLTNDEELEAARAEMRRLGAASKAIIEPTPEEP